jgi:ATP-dependent protease Clp ATPase subunit
MTEVQEESVAAQVTNCNFCNKLREQVFQLIVSPSGIAICNECIAECVRIINQKIDETKLPQLKFHGPAS